MGARDRSGSGPSLALLGGFELASQEDRIDLSPASERLLAFLGIHPTPLRRTFVSGSLWPDATIERANANLRSALWRVASAGPPDLVVASSTHLGLGHDVDVDFRAASDQARGVLHAEPVGEQGESLGLLCEDLLPDWYDDWVVFERERHRQLRLHALDRACTQLISARRYDEALEVALSEAEAEPLRETAFRFIVEIHIAEGNLVEAVRQYRSYASLLEHELGVLPSRSLRELLDRSFEERRPPAHTVRTKVVGQAVPTSRW